MATIERMFAPALDLIETEHADFDAAFPFGPVVRGTGYWFKRPG